MNNFVFHNPTKLIFGQGTERLAGAEASRFGNRVLLHYGGDSVRRNGAYASVMQSLGEAGLTVAELSGVKPNPRLSLVREGIRLCREERIDVILAVGGGSVIDSAKAIAAGVAYDGDVWDFFEKKAEIDAALPLGTVLTLPAAGSESNGTSVITSELGGYKLSVTHPALAPAFSILNPEFTFTLPPAETAAGCADMMSHVFERYFTRTEHVLFTDQLCEATLRTIIRLLPVVLEEPRHYKARAEIMWAGTIAHNGLLGTGREEDWASHLIAHELGALYDIAHGAALSIVFPAWMKHVYRSDLERFYQYAVEVWDVAPDGDRERVALEGIGRTERFFREAGLPVRLSEAGIDGSRIAEIARRCCSKPTGTIGNYAKLAAGDIANILESAR